MQLAAGDSHTCALTATGAAYCWGGNGRGELRGRSGHHRCRALDTVPRPRRSRLRVDRRRSDAHLRRDHQRAGAVLGRARCRADR
ncbi:MAG: hypothetical protein IPN47_19015 [Gemmatimonadetes bacterium]|nr:hypothetical protein [Gemmatimonadota bacterium]